MSINQLYHTLFEALRQLRPGERKNRLSAFVWFLVGMYQSRSVHLTRVGQKIPGQAKELSVFRNLERLVDNPAIRVREWYAPLAQAWLNCMASRVGQVRLIWDTTKVGHGYRLLMVSLAFRRRTIPIAWTWCKGKRGHSSAWVQLAVLAYVRQMIPPQTAVLLVGDTEFESGQVQAQLQDWQWQYALRQKSSNQVRLPGQSTWQNFAALVDKPGQSLWVEQAELTLRHAVPTHLLAFWQVGETEPWLLATNLPSAQAALRAYRRRMWIEEMFGDLKGNGFDLEHTRLKYFDRLSRLTLGAVLLYDWLICKAVQVVKSGQRPIVDRKDRIDLSLFQIGLRWIERCLKNTDHFSVAFCLTRLKVSGS